jgi:nitroimidazol reductase NimA-like FMN-containing flavoprotein (pyridoxamine 5'-phosphate oxidase superfamily)
VAEHEDEQPTPGERARRLIDQNSHMVIATTDLEGTPWVSPVFYVADDSYDLYWTSAAAARHSANIRESGAVAIVIFETEPEVDAVYLAGHAVELEEPDDVRMGIEIMGRKLQPERWQIEGTDDVTGEGPWRVYRAHPTTVEVREDGIEKGKAVAGREPADSRP